MAGLIIDIDLILIYISYNIPSILIEYYLFNVIDFGRNSFTNTQGVWSRWLHWGTWFRDALNSFIFCHDRDRNYYSLDKPIGPSALILVMRFSFVYFTQVSCVHSFLIVLCRVAWNRCETSPASKHLL